MAKQIRGVVSVLSTPFDQYEKIAHEDIARQVEAAVVFGISGVCLPAYASEFYKLSGKERLAVVKTAVDASRGRIAVVGQSNHPSARQAASLAKGNAEAGADLISFAIPRQFAAYERDILDYCSTICNAVDLPVLVQDFNPGGATVGPDFCRQLIERSPNFNYIKLEEPLLGPKLRAIREATSDGVGVLEGWGGMYMPELFESGIAGVMPGLGHADIMNRIWDLGTSGDMEGTLDVFDQVLAQVVFSLQDMELYLRIEKQLLAMRNIIQNTGVRSLSLSPEKETEVHGKRLNERVLKLVEQLGFQRNPIG
ncbi:MAG: dihydrodipicolinate synthase family protein [Gemmatimonadetes bacterium]|nr:dihydrodipicolinate synthase family protein [Gemmatimonadota bacterium]